MIIYRITNQINTKSYIGQTISPLQVRWKKHISCSKNKDTHFAKAIQKYGPDCWSLEILEKLNDINLLNEREIFWISYYDSFKSGYNSTTGGGQNTKFSEETKKKMSDARKGENNPMYGITSPNKGNKLSEEHKNKIAEKLIANKSKLNKKDSAATREKKRVAAINRHRNNYCQCP